MYELFLNHLIDKYYIMLIVSTLRYLLPPFLIISILFIFSANHRLSLIFCERQEKTELLPSLRAIMIVFVLSISLPLFAFNSIPMDFNERVRNSIGLQKNIDLTFVKYYILVFVALLITPLFYMKKNHIPIKPLFIVNKENLGLIIKYLLIGALGWIFISITIRFIHLRVGDISYINGVGYVRNPVSDAIFAHDSPPMRIYVSILGPLFEEICFRGMILSLLRKSFKTYICIIFSAFLFSAVPSHMVTFTAAIAAFGTGLLYAFLVSKTQSLWPSLLFHIAWNSAVFLR